jgi:ParB family chromosome partitioning protein
VTTPIERPEELVAIREITRGDRARSDLGDLDDLADSLAHFGMMQPIVIDATQTVIAGGRRLEAARRLGWTHVPVRRYGALSAGERLELELEENRVREDMDPTDEALVIAKLAQLARQVAADEDPNCSDSEHPRRRRGSLRDIERRIGYRPSRIHEAEAVAAILDRYPELRGLPLYRMQSVAGDLDYLPEPERRAFLARHSPGGRLDDQSEHGHDLYLAVQAAREARKTPARRVREQRQREEQAERRQQRRAEAAASYERWKLTQQVAQLPLATLQAIAERAPTIRELIAAADDPSSTVVADFLVPLEQKTTLDLRPKGHRPGLQPPPPPTGLTEEQAAEYSVRWLRAHVAGVLWAVEDLGDIAPRVIRKLLTAGEIDEAWRLARDGAEYLERLAAELSR